MLDPDDVLNAELPASYPWKTVSTVISRRDEMYSPGGDAGYYAVGVSAIQNIVHGLHQRGLTLDGAHTVLDMPCGHGRVTRVLRALSSAIMHVSDLNEDGVAFCAREFGAIPTISKPDFDALDIDERFDVIWVGSLITHLPAQATNAFIRFVLRHLTNGGVAVMSSHGAFVAARVQQSVLAGGEGAGTENGAARVMLEDYFTKGYGYADYPGVDPALQHYGVSLISREWLTGAVTEAGGAVLSYRDHAFDRHHDVICFGRLSLDTSVDG
jgi:SAM-dependent methyltransferase